MPERRYVLLYKHPPLSHLVAWFAIISGWYTMPDPKLGKSRKIMENHPWFLVEEWWPVVQNRHSGQFPVFFLFFPATFLHVGPGPVFPHLYNIAYFWLLQPGMIAKLYFCDKHEDMRFEEGVGSSLGFAKSRAKSTSRYSHQIAGDRGGYEDKTRKEVRNSGIRRSFSRHPPLPTNPLSGLLAGEASSISDVPGEDHGDKHVCMCIYIYSCEVIIWSKFGGFGSYYLVQVCFFF